MKLYRIQQGDVVVDWAGTQAEAKAAVKELGDASWHEEDVPTDKPSLLDWLKKYAVGKAGASLTKILAATPKKK